MAKTASVRLTDHVERFIEEQTASGRYASLQEVFEAGIELLERREQNDDIDTLDFGPAPVWTREALEEAIREGEESGIAGPFDVDELISELKLERETRKR
ncbi:type II toxin-antitoxin system ParD family antitoxin [Aureimonas psammosilenae]|uniref:type II toxin-antitoxin system ParD family antitoxin n=1 Tax=Aureimonas psammosilenae TaxID=2495496 RepID=UPI0012610C2D|nr:type II toxin-antitoxin system ParD family antitoxin [Aureimonas psammosilenae]